MLLPLLVVISIFFTEGRSDENCGPSSKWMRESTLDSNGLIAIKWNFTNSDITMIMIAQTKGWLAVGFGPKRRNFVCFALGWVNKNIPYLEDRHLEGNDTEPVSDSDESDYELIRGGETQNSTYICFRRNIITCDENDYNITEGTTKITWAVGKKDPMNGKLQYQTAKKGQKYLHLLSVVYPKPSSKTYFLQVRNKTVTAKEGSTVYWCSFYKIPPMNDQYYMTGFDAVISNQSKGIIHHMGSYICDTQKMAEVYDTINPIGYNCNNASIGNILEYCKEMFTIWAMGGEDQYLPPSTGMLFGSSNTTSYMRIEIHYNMESNKPDFTDDSMMKFFITKEKPQNVVGLLVTGFQIVPLMIIPPGQKSFSVIGICESKCVQKKMKNSEFTIIALRFHAHKTATTFKFHVFRDQQELKPNIEDNFDFEFQGFRYLKDEMKLLTTDTIVVECIYDTSARNKTIVGAEETEEEMCLVHVLYYPKMTNFVQCMSYIKPENILNLVGIQKIGLPIGIPSCNGTDCQAPIALRYFTPPIPIIEPEKYANKTVKNVLMNFTNWTSDKVQKVQRFYYEEQNPVCAGSQEVFYSKVTDVVQYPKNAVPYVSPDQCK